jgi:hypothetical protein
MLAFYVFYERHLLLWRGLIYPSQLSGIPLPKKTTMFSGMARNPIFLLNEQQNGVSVAI